MSVILAMARLFMEIYKQDKSILLTLPSEMELVSIQYGLKELKVLYQNEVYSQL